MIKYSILLYIVGIASFVAFTALLTSAPNVSFYDAFPASALVGGFLVLLGLMIQLFPDRMKLLLVEPKDYEKHGIPVKKGNKEMDKKVLYALIATCVPAGALFVFSLLFLNNFTLEIAALSVIGIAFYGARVYVWRTGGMNTPARWKLFEWFVILFAIFGLIGLIYVFTETFL